MIFRGLIRALNSAQRFAVVAVVLAFSAASAFTAFAFSPNVFAADSNVIFEGGAEKFVFRPGSEWTNTDLFHEFNNLMPGDEVTESIVVKNESAGPDYDYVNIYLRAVPHDENANPLSRNVAESGETVATMSDFLSKLSLVVKNNGETIYDAAPSNPDGLASNILLGSFKQGEGTTLTTTLKVPSSLGSRYMYRAGEVDWVFTAELMKNDEPVTSPDTGVAGFLKSDYAKLAGGFAIVVVVVALALIARKRIQKKI